jgi:hypothetical protein
MDMEIQLSAISRQLSAGPIQNLMFATLPRKSQYNPSTNFRMHVLAWTPQLIADG